MPFKPLRGNLLFTPSLRSLCSHGASGTAGMLRSVAAPAPRPPLAAGRPGQGRRRGRGRAGGAGPFKRCRRRGRAAQGPACRESPCGPATAQSTAAAETPRPQPVTPRAGARNCGLCRTALHHTDPRIPPRCGPLEGTLLLNGTPDPVPSRSTALCLAPVPQLLGPHCGGFHCAELRTLSYRVPLRAAWTPRYSGTPTPHYIDPRVPSQGPPVRRQWHPGAGPWGPSRCCCCCWRRCCCQRRAGRAACARGTAARWSPSTRCTPAAWRLTTAETSRARRGAWSGRCAAGGSCGPRGCSAAGAAAGRCGWWRRARAPAGTCPSWARCCGAPVACGAARSRAWEPPPATAPPRRCALTSSAGCPTATCSEHTSR